MSEKLCWTSDGVQMDGEIVGGAEEHADLTERRLTIAKEPDSEMFGRLTSMLV